MVGGTGGAVICKYSFKQINFNVRCKPEDAGYNCTCCCHSHKSLIYLQNLGNGATLQKRSGGSLSITNRETVRFIPAVGKVSGVQDPTTSETAAF